MIKGNSKYFIIHIVPCNYARAIDQDASLRQHLFEPTHEESPILSRRNVWLLLIGSSALVPCCSKLLYITIVLSSSTNDQLGSLGLVYHTVLSHRLL